jgi:hypothetical protein
MKLSEPLISFTVNTSQIFLNTRMIIGCLMDCSFSSYIHTCSEMGCKGDLVFSPFQVKGEKYREFVKFLQGFERPYTVVLTRKVLSGTREKVQDIQKYLTKRYPNPVSDLYPVTCLACDCHVSRHQSLLHFGECLKCHGIVWIDEKQHIFTESGQCPGGVTPSS